MAEGVVQGQSVVRRDSLERSSRGCCVAHSARLRRLFLCRLLFTSNGRKTLARVNEVQAGNRMVELIRMGRVAREFYMHACFMC